MRPEEVAEALEQAARQLNQDRTPRLDALAAGGALFVHATDLWNDAGEAVPLDSVSVGYGVMLGWLAREAWVPWTEAQLDAVLSAWAEGVGSTELSAKVAGLNVWQFLETAHARGFSQEDPADVRTVDARVKRFLEGGA